jgi:hypothetical protein
MGSQGYYFYNFPRGVTLGLREQAFDSSGLGVEVRQSDFRRDRKVLSKGTKDQLIADAVASAANNFNDSCSLGYLRKGSRDIWPHPAHTCER